MCDNLIGPPCKNPWNLARTSGASSGGAGSAVAAGLGPLAHGSDGSGSIRIPSALCGIFGLKPSLARVPYWPSADLWGARSHNGPMTRTVRDAAILLQIMAGPDARDPMSIDAPPEDYLATCEGDVRGWRVVRLPNAFVFDAPRGALLFAGVGGIEASSAEEEARGRIVFERARCGPRLRVRVRVDATLGSEFSDGEPLVVSGTFAAAEV